MSNNSYDSPNWTQTPNRLFDEDMRDMSNVELRVVLVAVRKIRGFHKERDGISLSQFEEMSGLSRKSVIKGIKEAIARGVLYKIDSVGKKGESIYALSVKSTIPSNSTSVVSTPVASGVSTHTKESLLKERKDSAPATQGTDTPPEKERAIIEKSEMLWRRISTDDTHVLDGNDVALCGVTCIRFWIGADKGIPTCEKCKSLNDKSGDNNVHYGTEHTLVLCGKKDVAFTTEIEKVNCTGCQQAYDHNLVGDRLKVAKERQASKKKVRPLTDFQLYVKVLHEAFGYKKEDIASWGIWRGTASKLRNLAEPVPIEDIPILYAFVREMALRNKWGDWKVSLLLEKVPHWRKARRVLEQSKPQGDFEFEHLIKVTTESDPLS